MAELPRRSGSTLSGTVKDQSAEALKLQIGDHLMRAGHITRGQLEEATKWLKAHPKDFLSVFLLKKNYIEATTIPQVLSRQHGFPTINLAEREIPPEVFNALTYEQAKKYMAVPYNKKENKLYIAMLEPNNSKHIEELTTLTKHQLMSGSAPFRDIIDAFRKSYAISDEEHNSFLAPLNPKDAEDSGPVTVDNLGALISDALDDFSFGDTGDNEAHSAEMYSAENSTIINLANQILLQAIQEGASDVHIEPFEKQFYVRYRIDGSLYKRTRLPLEIKNALIARVKIMSRLDITERRLPQDGRIKLRMSKTREIDFRVSALPTLFGESVVLRILDKSGLNVDLTKLGLNQRNLEQVQSAIYRPNGMFLVTGPTGSGKTVTLYSCLSLRNTDDVKILTAEDPVEFNFSGVNQVNVVKEAGMTFGKALKAFLRQDPDICMIGEIRDLDTGEIAVEASMTGHLVLSTLHTNDAPSTVTRLIDMGVPSFNVSAALVLCSAQRLMRKVCSECKRPMDKVPVNKLIEAGFSQEEVGTLQLYEGKGCGKCKGTGYKGRLGVFEIMECTPIVGEAISSKVPEAQLRKIALKEGMLTLRQDGLLKASQGLTTLEQVLEKTVLQKESLPHYLLNPDELVFDNGDVIIKEGNNDTNFYKLIQGSLGVYKGNTKIAEISQMNTYFGEMSVLLGGQRSATIKSEGKSIVKMFPGDKLMEVLEGYPDISKVMLSTLVDRLSSTNVRLSSYMHDKAELERTYIAQLTASNSNSTAGLRPIAGSSKFSAGNESASQSNIIVPSVPNPGEAARTTAAAAHQLIVPSVPNPGEAARTTAAAAHQLIVPSVPNPGEAARTTATAAHQLIVPSVPNPGEAARTTAAAAHQLIVPSVSAVAPPSSEVEITEITTAIIQPASGYDVSTTEKLTPSALSARPIVPAAPFEDAVKPRIIAAADRTTAISSLPATAQRFNAPDVTRLMTPKGLTAATQAARITASNAPKAKALRTA